MVRGSSIFVATRIEHVDAAIAALTLVLEPSEIARLEAAYSPRPKAGHS
jgi:aryl-alcohol dehydrogenase-like predicted oxidoreductase